MSNISIAERFIHSLGRGKIDESLCDPAMTVWTATSGDMPKETLFKSIAGLGAIVKGGLNFSILGVTDGGERVAIECTSEGILVNDQIYSNRYHMAFSFKDGKIIRYCEYFNTQLVYEKLAPLIPRLQRT